MKDLCQKWKVNYFFEAPADCQEPGLADCRGPGSAPEPYARFEYGTILYLSPVHVCTQVSAVSTVATDILAIPRANTDLVVHAVRALATTTSTQTPSETVTGTYRRYKQTRPGCLS